VSLQVSKSRLSPMLDKVKSFFSKPFVEAVGDTTTPDATCMRKCWAVTKDGRVGFIDHYKEDGKFGFRPVNFNTGRYYPNPSQHWTNEQRLKVPEELAVTLRDLRPAEMSEIPAMYRGVNGNY
jgi:hypothetical protein